jgi:putative tryptophan/tyrosine transport system substrate-binding protein
MDRQYSRRQIVQGAGLAGLGLWAGCGRWPGQVPTQPKVPRIGWLASSGPGPGLLLESFQRGLRELGYVEGQNLAIEYRHAEGQSERFPGLAAELVRLRVDAIVATGNPAIRAAKDATSSIPIIIINSRDPVGAGLVATLARPGGNVTGLSMLAPQLAGKRLELLKDTVPGLSYVGILWEGINPDRQNDFGEIQAAVQALGIRVQFLELQQPDDIESSFEAAARDRLDGLIVLPASLIGNRQNQVADLAAKHRLPSLYDRRSFVDTGGLMSYGPNELEQFRRAAYYVDRILKGAKPADLPVEQPMRFDFVLNLRTAQALGLTIPHHVLLQATEVIQ